MSEKLTIVATDNFTLRLEDVIEPEYALQVATAVNDEMEKRRADYARALNHFILFGSCELNHLTP